MFARSHGFIVKGYGECESGLRETYPNIDMKKTGILLKSKMEAAGHTPRMIQEYLHLSCPQPIYRWYKGSILPSVDHLFMISKLLGVHMEELLVAKQEKSYILMIDCDEERTNKEWLFTYYDRIKNVA